MKSYMLSAYGVDTTIIFGNIATVKHYLRSQDALGVHETKVREINADLNEVVVSNHAWHEDFGDKIISKYLWCNETEAHRCELDAYVEDGYEVTSYYSLDGYSVIVDY